MADDLVGRIRNAMQNTSVPLWFPALTAALADSAWIKLRIELQLTPSSYGTARVLRRDSEEPRRLVAFAEAPLCRGEVCEAIPIELLPKDLASNYINSGVRFFQAEEVIRNCVIDMVREALEILGGVPTILPSICYLIRALHLIDSGDDEVDVSFSEPVMPFSAFVSIPGPGAGAAALRVAEALLHEAMHLQLTFIESFVPLVKAGERTYFSPWRNEYRTAQGVLHALYVFRVIDKFLDSVSFDSSVCLTSRSHARERREMIARQVQEIREFRECADLTADGVTFVERLLH